MQMKLIALGCAVAAVLLIGFFIGKDTARISVIIVPHHDIVANERAEMIRSIASRIEGRRVILISPNHYDSGEAAFQVRGQDFSTRFGEVQIDEDLYAYALSSGASEYPISFEAEHGVKTVLPDLARYIDEPILPVIINDVVDQAEIDAFLGGLRDYCADCVLIASADFSHYQPFQISELHDRHTIRALRRLDSDAILTNAEVGPPHIVAAAINWARADDTNRFVLDNHTNSTYIEDDFYVEGTTHVFGWYEAGTTQLKDTAVSFTFIGDVFFDRSINTAFAPDYIQAFDQLGDRVLWGTDLVMANLECPLTHVEPVTKERDMPSFACSPAATEALEYIHINHINLANNHTFDAGQAGFDETIDALNRADITPVLHSEEPVVIMNDDQKIALFSVDRTIGQGLSSETLQNYEDANVVIYVHWGPEYFEEPAQDQVAFAHELIDAGADLIIGTGPHVLQRAEVYKNRPIFYSLGNFLFDLDDPVTQTGLIVAGEFYEDKLTLLVSSATSKRLKPVLNRTSESDHLLLEKLGLEEYLIDDRGGLLFEVEKR